jgi:uncharacterized protein YukJ
VKTNYLLLDYENIHPKNLSLLSGRSFKVLVFAGANQTKVPLELAAALQPLGNDVKYITISGSGRNALDFHIAFSIGELSKEDPEACFYIISKDTGFDPLIEHARKKNIHVSRLKSIADIPLLRTPGAQIMQEKVDAIVGNFAVRGSGLPRKEKTLANTINVIFQKALKEDDLKLLIQELNRQGHISIQDGKINYHLPNAPLDEIHHEFGNAMKKLAE